MVVAADIQGLESRPPYRLPQTTARFLSKPGDGTLGAVGVFVVPNGVETTMSYRAGMSGGADLGGAFRLFFGDRDDDVPKVEEGRSAGSSSQKRCSSTHVRRRADVGAGMRDGGDGRSTRLLACCGVAEAAHEK